MPQEVHSTPKWNLAPMNIVLKISVRRPIARRSWLMRCGTSCLDSSSWTIFGRALSRLMNRCLAYSRSSRWILPQFSAVSTTAALGSAQRQKRTVAGVSDCGDNPIPTGTEVTGDTVTIVGRAERRIPSLGPSRSTRTRRPSTARSRAMSSAPTAPVSPAVVSVAIRRPKYLLASKHYTPGRGPTPARRRRRQANAAPPRRISSRRQRCPTTEQQSKPVTSPPRQRRPPTPQAKPAGRRSRPRTAAFA